MSKPKPKLEQVSLGTKTSPLPDMWSTRAKMQLELDLRDERIGNPETRVQTQAEKNTDMRWDQVMQEHSR